LYVFWAVTVRDTGLKLAIDAAGGVSSLARGLGIAQPSVSSWQRIPADRIVAVEALTGLDRSQLRPDLFVEYAPANDITDDASEAGASEIDGLRAREYLLLAALLRFPVTADLLSQLSGICGDPTPLGLAHMALADAARATDERTAGREFFNLFIGVGRGELLPYASFYLTGFLNERPLGRVREDLAKLGIERAENNCDLDWQTAK
jgi:DNA-binding transcriptional regulator YdaS (Cro superfamily)